MDRLTPMFQILTLGFALLLTASQASPQTPAEPAPTVAFTFDDLPAHGPLAPGQARRDVVTSILATLKQERMPPVYGFVNAFRLDHHPYQIEILQAWHDAGEPVGNHTYSHEEYDTLSVATFARDVTANEPLLRKIDPQGDWHWFRFPYIEEGDTVAKREAALAYLKQHGYKVAEVSMSFEDYRWNDAYGLCSAKRDAASIQFLHDSYLAAADEYITRDRTLSHTLFGRDIPYVLLLHLGSFDARMLPELIALFRSRGFQFVTLPAAESDPVYAVDPGVAIKGGGTFQELVATSRGLSTPPESDILKKVDAVCH
jgi:peptidoglycan-N-acetylglucosamine deacetylase